VIIERRFRGPPESANGGYACGLVAELLGGSDAEVTLRAPPPLDRALAVERGDAGVVVLDGEQRVAEAIATPVELDAPPPPSFEEADRATAGFAWRTGHPFPGCFVCGPARDPGDGLLILPGPVEGRALAAAPWIPDGTVVDAGGRVRTAVVWAALDCPSWFGVLAAGPWRGGVLLGRLAARIHERPRAGERCVAVGWSLGRDGRKLLAASALYGGDGGVRAVARATWIGLKG
jgi:hypothetical protein